MPHALCKIFRFACFSTLELRPTNHWLAAVGNRERVRTFIRNSIVIVYAGNIVSIPADDVNRFCTAFSSNRNAKPNTLSCWRSTFYQQIQAIHFNAIQLKMPKISCDPFWGNPISFCGGTTATFNQNVSKIRNDSIPCNPILHVAIPSQSSSKQSKK